MLRAVCFLVLAGAALAQVHDAPPKPVVKVRRATPAEEAQGKKLFREKIRPMLVDHCLDCHGGRKTRGDFDCRQREAFLTMAHKSVPVVPFDSAASPLIATLERRRKPAMPPKHPLTPQQVADFKTWVDLGAPFDGVVVERAPGAW